MSPEPRFIADAMLGRLARWLRVLGADTLYDPHAADPNLVRIALEEGRWLITRDTRLASAARPGLRIILVRSDSWPEQLREVLAAAGTGDIRLFSRCTLCNDPLREAAAAEVAGEVPDFVLSVTDRFSRCPRCGRVYWAGSHQEGMMRELARAGIDVP